jgi:hypothetical protein
VYQTQKEQLGKLVVVNVSSWPNLALLAFPFHVNGFLLNYLKWLSKILLRWKIFHRCQFSFDVKKVKKFLAVPFYESTFFGWSNFVVRLKQFTW